jgi:toxin-antitoxin system PIN domain toxin
MQRSLRSFLFPDVNVWVALTLESHVHNPIAAQWLAGLGRDSGLCFCRITQLSLLRLLTTRAVMGSEVMSQLEAWQVYDRWLEDTRVVFLDEPVGLEPTFRAHSRRTDSSPKDWADSYLVAFATVAGLTLVSFDRGFKGKTKDLLLLTS